MSAAIDMLETALWYASGKWAVFPCGTDKKPLIDSGFHGATKNPDTIKTWWQQWPNANIGLACGPSGLIAIDFDPAHAKPESRAFFEDLSMFYPTTSAKTPTGGEHLIYKLPDGVDLNNSNKNLPGGRDGGIDIRVNGYILLAPSEVVYRGEDAVKKGVEDGHTARYEWVVGYAPNRCLPQPLPQHVIDILAPKPKPKATQAAHSFLHVATDGTFHNPYYVRAAIDKELAELRATSSGRNSRLNDAAYSLAGYLWTGVFTETELEDWLYQAAIDNGYVAKDGDGEVRATIRSGLDRGQQKSKSVPVSDSAQAVAAAQAAIGGGDAQAAPSAATATNGAGATSNNSGSGQPPPNGGQQATVGPTPVTPPMYFVGRDGGIWFNKRVEQKGVVDYEPVPVATFSAAITAEIVDAQDEKSYLIEGKNSEGKPYKAQIAAAKLADERELKAILKAAAGPRETVYARMGAHLAPAVSLLTSQWAEHRRYDRTGWEQDGRFLIPGREPTGVHVILPEKMTYNLSGSHDSQHALTALDDLLNVLPRHKATVILAHMLIPPLAKLAGLTDERGGLVLEGTSGVFKTSMAQQFMSTWGAGFGSDDKLLTWGEGATANSMRRFATYPFDMPFFVDNFKPNTGRGADDFVPTVHAIMEGSEKSRLDRNSEMRDSRPIACWPFFTGEAIPRGDSATLARLLNLQIETGDCNLPILTRLQAGVKHHPAIGAMWLDWLESDDGRTVAKSEGARFADYRTRWADFLRQHTPKAVNPHRIASNLAVNELALVVAAHHPVFGGVVAPYKPQHVVGLEEIATQMGSETREATEAERFLTALRECVGGGRAILTEKHVGKPSQIDADRHIGWGETDGSVYLLADVTLAVVTRYTTQKFNGFGQIRRQLNDMGLIQSKDTGRLTKNVNIPSVGTQRTLHLKKEAVEG